MFFHILGNLFISFGAVAANCDPCFIFVETPTTKTPYSDGGSIFLGMCAVAQWCFTVLFGQSALESLVASAAVRQSQLSGVVVWSSAGRQEVERCVGDTSLSVGCASELIFSGISLVPTLLGTAALQP